MESYGQIPNTPDSKGRESTSSTPLRRNVSLRAAVSPFSRIEPPPSPSISLEKSEDDDNYSYTTTSYGAEDPSEQDVPPALPITAETPPYGKSTSALIEDKQNLAWNEKYQLLLDALPSDFIDSPEHVRLQLAIKIPRQLIFSARHSLQHPPVFASTSSDCRKTLFSWPACTARLLFLRRDCPMTVRAGGRAATSTLLWLTFACTAF